MVDLSHCIDEPSEYISQYTIHYVLLPDGVPHSSAINLHVGKVDQTQPHARVGI